MWSTVVTDVYKRQVKLDDQLQVNADMTFDLIGNLGTIDYKTAESKEIIASYEPVSYTHLDVYKRQLLCRSEMGWSGAAAGWDAIAGEIRYALSLIHIFESARCAFQPIDNFLCIHALHKLSDAL